MIYLDHAAATPVNPKVLKAMEPYFSRDFFNPSSPYLPAKKVAADYEAAKSTIAHAIGAKSHDLVITAGATEANNLAFTCLENDLQRAACLEEGYQLSLNENEKGEHGNPRHKSPRILYLATEHDSVRRVAEKYGANKIAVDKYGRINLDDLKHKITDDTELISVALAGNELGTIQPLSEISAIIKEVKLDRLRRGIKTKLLLHSDASQALNLLDINVARLGVDLLTLNAAKVYGPKGVGALYVSHDVRLQPLTAGGGQENGLRSGTENVPSVIGFAKAVELAKEHVGSNRKKYSKFRQILLSELQNYELINKKHALDNFITLCYNGIDAERLIYLLEDKEVYLSTGAACAASKGQKSHVLAAIGLTDEQIAGSLRISLGETNTEDQLYTAAKIINEVVNTEKKRLEERHG